MAGNSAYVIRQREREIAIRMALGATEGGVIGMFLRDTGKVLLVGIAAGIFGGTSVSRILLSQLHGVESFDSWTLVATSSFLATAGLVATWLPTRRVARTDPATGLRTE